MVSFSAEYGNVFAETVFDHRPWNNLLPTSARTCLTVDVDGTSSALSRYLVVSKFSPFKFWVSVPVCHVLFVSFNGVPLEVVRFDLDIVGDCAIPGYSCK